LCMHTCWGGGLLFQAGWSLSPLSLPVPSALPLSSRFLNVKSKC
jgi:nitrogen fixation protein